MKYMYKVISAICILTILIITATPTYALIDTGDGDNVLIKKDDGAGCQAFAMQVTPTDSTASIQAFCVGWTFTITSKVDPLVTVTIETKVGLRTGHETKDFLFPVSNGWTGDPSSIVGGDSLYDVATAYEKTQLDKIFIDGGNVVANACIEKYSWVGGNYTPLGIFANNETELNARFSEFPTEFMSNITTNYFNWTGAIDPEPVVLITLPENNTTVPRGTVVTFKGFGNRGIHHINGYINGEQKYTQNNPNADISTQMKFETPVMLDTVGTYVFQLKGSSSPSDLKLIPSQTRTVTVVEPKVLLTSPINGTTVTQGTTVTFKGFGNNGVHHMDGYVDGVFLSTQNNPSTDVMTQMKYETNIKLDQIKDYTFQIKGSPTSSTTPTLTSEVRTVHVVAPVANSGTVHTICLDYAANTQFDSQAVYNEPYNTPRSVSAPTIEGYSAKGSYSSYSNSIPAKTSMQAGTLSQTVTVTSTNKDVYVYCWYDKTAPIPSGCTLYVALPATFVGVGEQVTVDANIDDSSGHTITDYNWSAPDASSASFSGDTAVLVYNEVGEYDLNLEVTCSNGVSASTTAVVYVIEIDPKAEFYTSGRIKENRKITFDARASTTPDKYSIDWTKNTWHIEPDLSTGATWDIGVKLYNGTIVKIDQNTDQSFLNGEYIFDFQARYSGNYKVTLSVTNSYPRTNTLNKVVFVARDLPPVADCNAQELVLREHDNPVDATKQKYGIIPVVDASYSPDGEVIGKRTWGYRWNSENNKDSNGKNLYTDDITKYMYTGSLLTPFLPTEGQRLVVENSNDTTVEIYSYDVGGYSPEVTVEEIITDNETIKELLLPIDIRKTTISGW